MKEFKDRLKQLRCSAELTQDQLSLRLNVSRSAISMYEQGKREPDFETLEKIADFFNVDMNYLTGWTDDAIGCCDPDLIAEHAGPLLDHFIELYGNDVKAAVKAKIEFDKAAKQDAVLESTFIERYGYDPHVGPTESPISNPNIRAIARAGKNMTNEQAENIRKYAEFMFPEAFNGTKK